jgi:hypothetical protein
MPPSQLDSALEWAEELAVVVFELMNTVVVEEVVVVFPIC